VRSNSSPDQPAPSRPNPNPISYIRHDNPQANRNPSQNQAAKIIDLSRVLECSIGNAYAFSSLIKSYKSDISLDEILAIVRELRPGRCTPRMVLSRFGYYLTYVSNIDVNTDPRENENSISNLKVRDHFEDIDIRKGNQDQQNIEWETHTDAFDHTKFIAGEEIYFCKIDQIAYHIETYQYLLENNDGKCLCCKRKDTMTRMTLPGKSGFNAASKPDSGFPITHTQNRTSNPMIIFQEIHESDLLLTQNREVSSTSSQSQMPNQNAHLPWWKVALQFFKFK